MTDWYHKSYNDIVKAMLAPNGSPRVVSDNNLINGKMNFVCSTKAAGDNTPCVDNAGISKFRFKKGKTHRLRLINSGAEGVQRFTIDGHNLTVIANDFVPVKPYTTNIVTLGVGQRADVLVTADVGDTNSAFWMRSTLTGCAGNPDTPPPAKQPYAVAAIYYDTADSSKAPTSQPWNIPNPVRCTNDDLAVTEPLYPMPLPEATFTQTMDISTFKNASNVTLWLFDGVSMRANYDNPVLLLANEGNFSYPAEWNVRNYYTNSSVRVIVNNNSPAAYVFILSPSPLLGKK